MPSREGMRVCVAANSLKGRSSLLGLGMWKGSRNGLNGFTFDRESGRPNTPSEYVQNKKTKEESRQVKCQFKGSQCNSPIPLGAVG